MIKCTGIMNAFVTHSIMHETKAQKESRKASGNIELSLDSTGLHIMDQVGYKSAREVKTANHKAE